MASLKNRGKCGGGIVKHFCDLQQGKSGGFDSCHGPSNITVIGLKLSIFQPVSPLNLMDDPEK